MKKNALLKKVNGFFKKYINGTKGAISLLLVLVMSPLLSISLILVESARYQNAVELMQEIADSSAFSTLANYDSYLDERFGVLSVSQDADINTAFTSYLSKNVDILGSNVTVNSQSAKGEFALSNTEVLKQQILEYSEISVVAEAMTNIADLDELLKELEKVLDMKDINDEIRAANAGVDLAKEIEKLLEAIIKANDQYNNKYYPALTSYQDAYSDFETKLIELADALETAEDELEEEDDWEDIFNDKDVKKAIKAAKKSRDDYNTKASTLKTELSAFKGYIDNIFSALDKIPSKLQKFDEGTSEATLAEQCTTSTYEWIKIIVDQITTTMKTTVGDDYKDKINSELQLLQDQIVNLANFNDKTVSSSWDASKIESEYGMIGITSIGEYFASYIEVLMSDLNQTADVDDSTALQMKDLLDIAGELLGISGLYDSSLDSIVSSASLYVNTSMSRSSTTSMDSLTDLIDACSSFVDGITSLNIIKAVKALGKLLKSIAEFLAAVVLWVSETAVNLITYIISGPKEWYNSLLLYGYGAYNLPNRTNYPDGKTLSSYSYSKIFDLAGGVYRHSLTGSLKDLNTIGNTTGTDKLFKGAEAEYLLVGSTSELMNQSVTFFDLYMFRLVLDMVPIMKNQEVSSIAALAGSGSWVVKLAIILAEPMLDTIILVNGGDEYLIKDTIYISYSGFIALQNDLVGITSISKNLQGKIKDTIKANNGEVKKKGKFKTSYTDHMLFLLLLSVNQQTYMQRMQNLIQMEAACKYESQYSFKLDQAYTYVYSDVKYTLNPMFKLDSLTNSGVFTADSKQYIGY